MLCRLSRKRGAVQYRTASRSLGGARFRWRHSGQGHSSDGHAASDWHVSTAPYAAPCRSDRQLQLVSLCLRLSPGYVQSVQYCVICVRLAHFSSLSVYWLTVYGLWMHKSTCRKFIAVGLYWLDWQYFIFVIWSYSLFAQLLPESAFDMQAYHDWAAANPER